MRTAEVNANEQTLGATLRPDALDEIAEEDDAATRAHAQPWLQQVQVE